MSLEQLFEKFESPTQLDFKLNFKKFFSDSSLTPKEAGLIALACAESVRASKLSEVLIGTTKDHASAEEITEARDMAAIMGTANCYYRFRHYIPKDAYKRAAGFRMTSLARPIVGKEISEMMALAVSIINGCETCCVGHEKGLVELGVSEDKIHDLARLASTIKGLEVFLR